MSNRCPTSTNIVTDISNPTNIDGNCYDPNMILVMVFVPDGHDKNYFNLVKSILHINLHKSIILVIMFTPTIKPVFSLRTLTSWKSFPESYKVQSIRTNMLQ